MATYPKSSKTREHIFQKALALFAAKGYQATSLKDIAEAAEVSTGTLYRYFPSKGDLLFELRRVLAGGLRGVAAALPEEMPLVDRMLEIMAADKMSLSQNINQQSSGEGAPSTRLELSLAARRETYGSKEQLAQEEEYRQKLRSIYQEVIERAQEEELLDNQLSAKDLSEIASALYFQAIDQSILDSSLDIDEALRPKLEILFRS